MGVLQILSLTAPNAYKIQYKFYFLIHVFSVFCLQILKARATCITPNVKVRPIDLDTMKSKRNHLSSNMAHPDSQAVVGNIFKPRFQTESSAGG